MSTLRDELQHIYEEHGQLTPALVLDTARNPDHPLHPRFTWDDEAAAEAHRIDQARNLIRSVRVVYREADDKEGARSVRAYHSVRTEEGCVYRSTDEVVASPFLTELLMRDMTREWQQLKRRWARFSEFTEMVRSDLKDGEAA